MAKPEFAKFQFDNGVTLVAERHKYVSGVSIGVWVGVGSSSESPPLNGVSHFIEHMVFKGTEKHSAIDLVTAIESIGGDLNAFTDREYTCYHSTVLKQHTDVALEILSELLFHPAFQAAEIEKERKILLQEMASVEDVPDEWIGDLFFETVWPNEPLGHSILGSKKTINSFTRAQIKRYFRNNYRPENIIISAAGNLDINRFRDQCEKYFGHGPRQKAIPLRGMASQFRSRRKSVQTELEQLHLLLGFDGIGFKDPARFDAIVLSFFLGGGMSSRLFQEIREKAALAYTVECDFIPFTEVGLFSIYAATSQRALSQILAIIKKEIGALLKNSIPEKNLNEVKGQLKGAILLASDHMEIRQESLGRNELIFGRYIGVDEVIRMIDEVTAESVHELCKRMFVPKKESMITIGRKKYKAAELTIF